MNFRFWTFSFEPRKTRKTRKRKTTLIDTVRRSAMRGSAFSFVVVLFVWFVPFVVSPSLFFRGPRVGRPRKTRKQKRKNGSDRRQKDDEEPRISWAGLRPEPRFKWTTDFTDNADTGRHYLSVSSVKSVVFSLCLSSFVLRTGLCPKCHPCESRFKRCVVTV